MCGVKFFLFEFKQAQSIRYKYFWNGFGLNFGDIYNYISNHYEQIQQN